MAKKSTVFVCTGCGHEEFRWLGRCPSCGEWNSFKEMKIEQTESGNTVLALGRASRAAAGKARSAAGASSGAARGGAGAADGSGGRAAGSAAGTAAGADEAFGPVPLSDVVPLETQRLDSGIGELDRVLGGGIMLGSSVLIGGEPGIGKSTLMLQAAGAYRKHARVLYVSGEETGAHLKLRAERLGIDCGGIQVLTNPQLETILSSLAEADPGIVIVDSIQTLVTELLDSAPGTVNQMKMSVYAVSQWARQRGAGVFYIAHVTKDGVIAGPKLIEHMVDAVLMFEHSGSEMRFLRAVKNRFGSVDEIGLFTMAETGLEELKDPSRVFLGDRQTPVPAGVVAAPIFEGSRVLVVEIQALTVPAQGGYGRVYSDKMDTRRINRLCAVLEKHAGIRLSDQDVYLNVAGGMRIVDVGAELPAALAVMSARTGQPLNRFLAVAGEVSLSGELRPVAHMRQRFGAVADLGFTRFLGPRGNRETNAGWQTVGTIGEAIRAALEG